MNTITPMPPSNANVIPPITEPLGKYWKQPDPSGFLIDDTHVVMTRSDFQRLAEYSATNPTEDCRWLLCWFGPVREDADGRFVSNNYREILIVA